jgi:hypothetical protein
MGRRRPSPSSTALACAIILSASAAIALVIALANPGPRPNIITVCFVVAAAALWLAWQHIRAREAAAEDSLEREAHVDSLMRHLRSKSDSDR